MVYIKLQVSSVSSVKLNIYIWKVLKTCTSSKKILGWSLMFFIKPNMRKIIIIKVGFCKTFRINNIINPIIILFISYQMRWLDDNDDGLD